MTETESELNALKLERAALAQKIEELEAQRKREKDPQVLDVFSYKGNNMDDKCLYIILSDGYLSVLDRPGDKTTIIGQGRWTGPQSVFCGDHYKYEGHFSDVFVTKESVRQLVEGVLTLEDKYADTLQKSASEGECWYLNPKGTQELWELVEGLSEQVS